MRASMIDTLTDENGHLDFGRQQHGSGMSRSAEVRILSFRSFFLHEIDSGEEISECSSTCCRNDKESSIFHK